MLVNTTFGGERLGGLAAAAMIERRNPATGRIVSNLPADTLEDVPGLVSKAARAFGDWSARALPDRRAMLITLAQIITKKRDAFETAMREEIGATRSWAAHNVDLCCTMLRDVANLAGRFEQVHYLETTSGVESRAQREACGVVLSIVPWNAPLILGMRALATPLVCGNTVLLKGNELAPRTFRLLGEALDEAGFGQGVAQVVICRDEDSEKLVETLIASPVVRRVNFTGSSRVGRSVALHCAQHLKRPLLALGDQAPMIVLEDADLDRAARAAALGGFQNQGQICLSTERVIVADKIAEAFVDKLEALRAQIKVGDPDDIATQCGPVIDEAAADRLEHLVNDAIQKGAVLVGGGRLDARYFAPTIVDHVTPDMRIASEEVFGPILSVMRVSSEVEALTVANDSSYGLTASIFSKDIARAQALAGKVQSGMCHINRTTVNDDAKAPFGGMKASGFGRFGGSWAFDEFTELRWITRAIGEEN